MRIASLLVALALSASVFVPTMAAPVSTATPPKLSLIASNADCTAQRKVCYAGKTQTDGNGARYVPPEAVRDCEAAFRMCVRGH